MRRTGESLADFILQPLKVREPSNLTKNFSKSLQIFQCTFDVTLSFSNVKFKFWLKPANRCSTNGTSKLHWSCGMNVLHLKYTVWQQTRLWKKVCLGAFHRNYRSFCNLSREMLAKESSFVKHIPTSCICWGTRWLELGYFYGQRKATFWRTSDSQTWATSSHVDITN